MKYLILPALALAAITGCKTHPGNEANHAVAPELPYHTVALTDTAGFLYTSAHHLNWTIAGNVYSDRNVVHSLETTAGTGMLVSRPTTSDKAELITRFQHGDMDLELDFMMPKGSNSGVYFMGRYEVQLFDSWMKPQDSLHYGDCGGIYERMADGHGFDGCSPILNACKAPGLWQHLKVRFRAPRFDSSGKKIQNACFEWVYLNGALVQKNTAVSGPTLGTVFIDEAPSGPLVLQGSHGPVAFKNIRIKRYINGRIRLKNMQLKVYKSLYPDFDTLQQLKPDRILYPDSLSQLSYNKFEQGVYQGKMIVPATGDYIFTLQAGGPAALWIDHDSITGNNLSGDYFQPWYGARHLTQGEHSFTLIYNNRYQQFKLSYEGSAVLFTTLTTESSAFSETPPEPYILNIADQTVNQRGFFMHRGKKYTHAIAIGFPRGINYAYSLSNYNLLGVWRGRFLDAADMWRERGEEQLERPLGAVTELTAKAAVQLLPSPQQPWPDSVAIDAGIFTNRGYRLLKDKTPVFFYTYQHTDITDYLHPDSSGQALVRDIIFDFHTPGQKLYFLIADGGLIKQLPDGAYAVDNYNCYVANIYSSGQAPTVIKSGNRYKLVVPVVPRNGKAEIKYEIIW